MMRIAKDTKQSSAAKPHRFYSRLADRSLPAYKAWICGTYEAMIAQADLPSKEDDMTEEEWARNWNNFWNGYAMESEQE